MSSRRWPAGDCAMIRHSTLLVLALCGTATARRRPGPAPLGALGVGPGPGRGSRLVQDPCPERPHLRPLPGGRRGDEAAAFGRLGLTVEERDQRPALQLPRDQHRPSDGGAELGHRGLDQHAVEAEARGPRQVRRGLALAGEPVRPRPRAW